MNDKVEKKNNIPMAIFKPKRIILVFKFEYTSLLKIKSKKITREKAPRWWPIKTKLGGLEIDVE